MQRARYHVMTFVLSLVATGAFADAPVDQAALETELAATERAFAQTMAERDHAAFVGFLAADTIFIGSQGPLRGADAVSAAWQPFFEGETAPFSWRPDVVVVQPSGELGLSSGPVLAPDGTNIGSFNSVWQRQDDGSWRIIFDKGCPPCGP